MRVDEVDGKFEVMILNRVFPDVTLELADLVELRAEIDRVLMDYLARNVARLLSKDSV